MKLSTLAVLLGLGFGLPQIYPLVKPAKFREAARKFPRSEPWGYAFMLLGTAWFLWNLKQENIADFAAYKPYMLAGFGLVGVATCVFVRDFLAVRGFAIVLLLLAKFTLDTQRWADTDWKNVVAAWAYVWVVAGMCFTIWPWWLRDWIHWNTASDLRIRIGSLFRLALGVFVAGLGLTVFREVERESQLQREAPGSSSVERLSLQVCAASTAFPERDAGHYGEDRGMGYIRLRPRRLWSAGASEARPRFGSLGAGSERAKAPSPLRSAGALQRSRMSPILRTPAAPGGDGRAQLGLRHWRVAPLPNTDSA